MERKKAHTLLNKKIKFVLANGFIFSGMVVKVDDFEIVIIDQKADRTHISVEDISSYSEVKK